METLVDSVGWAVGALTQAHFPHHTLLSVHAIYLLISRPLEGADYAAAGC